jgi:hypothetical protein
MDVQAILETHIHVVQSDKLQSYDRLGIDSREGVGAINGMDKSHPHRP